MPLYMKNIILLTVFLSATISCSQEDSNSSNPSKEETQQWIKEKIAIHAFDNGHTAHNYYISFDENNLIVNHKLWDDITGTTTTSYERVSINDIDYIYTSEKISTIWLIIKLKTGKTKISSYENENGDVDEKLIFILNKNFKNDNLPERLKKAFAYLVEVHTGKKNTVKETF